MRATRWLRAGAGVITLASGLAVSLSTTSSSIAAATTTKKSFAATTFTTKLSGVCPNPLVVQTNWLPESDNAALYELIGSGGTMKQYSYEGPLGSTGIKLQILSGGPGDGYAPTATTLYTSNPVVGVTADLTEDSTETTLQFSKKFPTIGVDTLQDHDPQILIYSPTKFSNLSTVADMIKAANAGAHFYVTSLTTVYVEYLIKEGVPQSAFIGGYSGDLEKFVTGSGLIINQGYSDAEPYTLAHDTPAWGNKPIKYTYVYKLGLNDYPSAIQVASDKLKQMTPCLKKLVPIIQAAQVDYAKSPATADKVLAQFNPTYSASYWTTPTAESAWAVNIQKSQDIVGNGINGTGAAGEFDVPRTTAMIKLLMPIIASASPGTYNPDATASELVTNKFIDKSIRYPS
jgi:hypothetical protein